MIRSSAQYDNPVVFFANAIGDHLMTLPTVRALSQIFEGRLACLGYGPIVYDLFRGVRFKWLATPSLHCEENWEFEPKEVASYLKSADLLISLNPWHSPSMDHLLKLIKGVPTIGFNSQFEESIIWNKERHACDSVFQLAKHFAPDKELESYAKPPCLPKNATEFADNVRAAIPPTYRILGLHTESKPEKSWQGNLCNEFINMVLNENSDIYIIHLGKENMPSIHDRHISIKNVPLNFSLALVAICDNFVCVDSMFLHAADLYRKPSIGLFGPTKNSEFGFRFSKNSRYVECEGEVKNIIPIEVFQLFREMCCHSTILSTSSSETASDVRS